MVVNNTRKYLKNAPPVLSSLRVTQSIFVYYPNPAKLVFHLAVMLGVEV